MKLIVEQVDKPILITGAGVIIAVGALILTVVNPPVMPWSSDDVVPAMQDPLAGSERAPTTSIETVPAPSFDVVRTDTGGQSVIAGRGAPESTIVVRDGDTVVGTAKADKRGEWVLIPDAPLPPGSHQLALEMVADDGRIVTGDDEVVLFIPSAGTEESGPADEGAQPLSVRISRAGIRPPEVLQKPGGMVIKGGIVIDTVGYDGANGFMVTGRAAPNADVHVLLDETMIGASQANGAGAWNLVVDQAIAEGEHRLTVHYLDATGAIAASDSRSFLRVGDAAGGGAGDPGSAESGRVEIAPGNNLWRIARDIYGRGVAYTLIYDANRNQIADPDLIYPGQILTLPPSD